MLKALKKNKDKDFDRKNIKSFDMEACVEGYKIF